MSSNLERKRRQSAFKMDIENRLSQMTSIDTGEKAKGPTGYARIMQNMEQTLSKMAVSQDPRSRKLVGITKTPSLDKKLSFGIRQGSLNDNTFGSNGKRGRMLNSIVRTQSKVVAEKESLNEAINELASPLDSPKKMFKSAHDRKQAELVHNKSMQYNVLGDVS